MAKKKVEEIYQKLSQRMHVLVRPDTYVGSVNLVDEKMFVVDSINNIENIKVIKDNVKFVPAFIKIFDEILTNASDHYIRTDKVKYIKVSIDEHSITIENDGDGIPIELHKTEKVWIPELIFFNLLAGSNFNDNEQRFVGGRNGLGVKLTGIFSKKFILETADGKKKYVQEVKDNLYHSIPDEKYKAHLDKFSPPKISNSSKNYTKITFYPDFEKFGLSGFGDDILKLLLKRTLDIASYCPKVKVYFNDTILPIKTPKDYMLLHLKSDNELFYEKLDNGWEVGIAKSESGNFEQVSIVNGITTYRGGTHVNYISSEISKDLAEKLSTKKNKVSWADVKNKLFIFLICKIPNPTFDTQTKEYLTNNITKDIHLNSKISELTIKKIMKSDIVESILHALELKEKEELRKLQKSSQKLKIEKLVDANSKDRSKCQILIFEGECLEEKTNIRIINDNGICDKEIKDAEVGDAVITHKNRLSLISSITKKIGKKVIIKNKLGDIECSSIHKWFVYDTKSNKFYFVKTNELDKNIHKLVKNYLAFLSDLIKINDKIKIEDEKYDYRLNLDGYEDDLFSTSTHKFACYNKQSEFFEMISCENLHKDIHLIVNLEDKK